MKNYTITIGREFGSGGREIAQQLADRLGIEYYDKALITLAAKKKGISEDIIAGAEESMARPWETNAIGLPIFQDRLYVIQTEIIQDLAENHSPCIIVGRCGDYVLRDHPNVLSVFIYADRPFRVQRIRERHNLTTEGAIEMIKKTDKTRRAYYQYYTDRKWGKRENSDIVLNSATLGIDTCVDILYAMVKGYSEG